MSREHDMAHAYLQLLIKQHTELSEVEPDEQGDYGIPMAGTQFLARVDGHEHPIVRIYTIALDEVQPSADLYEQLNEINSEIAFARALWVQRQVLIEAEHLARTLDREDFLQAIHSIAQATGRYREKLARFASRDDGTLWQPPSSELPDPRRAGYL